MGRFRSSGSALHHVWYGERRSAVVTSLRPPFTPRHAVQGSRLSGSTDSLVKRDPLLMRI